MIKDAKEPTGPGEVEGVKQGRRQVEEDQDAPIDGEGDDPHRVSGVGGPDDQKDQAGNCQPRPDAMGHRVGDLD